MKGNRSRKVFYNMILSYTLVVLLIAAVILFASVNFSREIIYAEIGKFNERILQSTADKVRTLVIASAQAAYLDLTLSGDQSGLFPRDDLSNDNITMLHIYNTLKSNVTKHANVDRLHIYYRDENIMISSNYGYKEFTTRRFAGNYAWLPAALDGGGTTYLTEVTASSQDTQNYIAITYPYPYGVSRDRALSYIIVMIEERRISALLGDAFSATYNNALIADSSGRVVSSPDRSDVFSTHMPDVSDWIDPSSPYGMRTYSEDGGDFVFSYYHIDGTDWYLINTLSIRDFYAPYFTMRFRFIALTALVALVGVQVAAMLSRHFTRPSRSSPARRPRASARRSRGSATSSTSSRMPWIP